MFAFVLSSVRDCLMARRGFTSDTDQAVERDDKGGRWQRVGMREKGRHSKDVRLLANDVCKLRAKSTTQAAVHR